MTRCDRCGLPVNGDNFEEHFHGGDTVRPRAPEPPPMRQIGTIEPIRPPPEFVR